MSKKLFNKEDKDNSDILTGNDINPFKDLYTTEEVNEMVSKKVNNTGDPLFNDIIKLIYQKRCIRIIDMRIAVEKYVDSRIDKKIEAMFVKSTLEETVK